MTANESDQNRAWSPPRSSTPSGGAGRARVRRGERAQAGRGVSAARRGGQVGDRAAEQRRACPAGRRAVALEQAAARQAVDVEEHEQLGAAREGVLGAGVARPRERQPGRRALDGDHLGRLPARRPAAPRLAAAHRDDHVPCGGGLLAPQRRVLGAEVRVAPGHGRDHRGAHATSAAVEPAFEHGGRPRRAGPVVPPRPALAVAARRPARAGTASRVPRARRAGPRPARPAGARPRSPAARRAAAPARRPRPGGAPPRPRRSRSARRA